MLVCLHGLVDRLEIWDRLTPGLRDRGRVVRVDQRGHGESEAPPGPYGRADLAADVVAVLDTLGIARAILVGHSMGGIVSMATTLGHPERVAGLVLIGTASRCSEKVAQWYERIAVAGERDGLGGLARTIYGEKTGRTITGQAEGIAHVTRMLKSLYDDPLTPVLGEVRCPALLLVGEHDPMGPRASSTIADALVDAELHVIPDCGHWVHVEKPASIVEAMGPWLERIGAGRDPRAS